MRASRIAIAALVSLVALSGCERSGVSPRPMDNLSNDPSGDLAPGASRPAPVALTRYFFPDCFDVYAECPATRGLPAVSADGAQVALADTGARNARDEFQISLVLLDVATDRRLDRQPLLTLDDHRNGWNHDTDEPSASLRRQIDERITRAERSLAPGGFRPLAYLGKVHEQRPSEVMGGVQATFDGVQLTITKDEQVVWRRAIDPASAESPHCSSYPVAEIHVWVHHKTSTALARVSYTTSHGCDVAPRYMVWR